MYEYGVPFLLGINQGAQRRSMTGTLQSGLEVLNQNQVAFQVVPAPAAVTDTRTPR
jgi:hypothetical protein